ncbi:zinc-dependent metalloprotease [Alkalihalobacillus sp. AL-G]|uniref:zinc-dependent metalloprotease n=1 Tax=Alkalihalobacillus sp. AL-G TaxID=2926399 RepID=UPI0027299AF7|nr:zinc-dependent metalloprotease [Alkalihalobacillus sp. AL-G]WLD94696.1 zinc-dependent metalloprotease [Alkalihalobacillus sp. AL-G]
MKFKKVLLTLSLGLSLALVPTLSFAHDASPAAAPQIEVLPKAKTKLKENSKKPAVVESDTTAKILNEKGNVVGKRTFKSNKTDDADSQASIAATRTVTVLAVADEEYRSAYGDWQTRIQNIVEYADNAFNRDHAIDFQVHALAAWSSQGGNSSQILQDLGRDFDGLGYDFVVGFTRDSAFDAGGIAYVYGSAPYGSALSVNLDQGVTNTWHASQHEFSHNFGLGHDPQGSGIRCIMNYDYSYSVDYWHPEHDSQIEQNEYWY